MTGQSPLDRRFAACFSDFENFGAQNFIDKKYSRPKFKLLGRVV